MRSKCASKASANLQVATASLLTRMDIESETVVTLPGKIPPRLRPMRPVPTVTTSAAAKVTTLSPAPNRALPGRAELTRAQRIQIHQCIQRLVQNESNERRPWVPWQEKMALLRQEEGGEERVAAYFSSFSLILSRLTEIMVRLLRMGVTVAKDGLNQGLAGLAKSGDENIVTIDCTADPTLQQFIDRVNDAMEAKHAQTTKACKDDQSFHDFICALGLEGISISLVQNAVDSKEGLAQLASCGLPPSDCIELGMSTEQRFAIMEWYKLRSRAEAAAGAGGGPLVVASVAIDKEALFHPIVGASKDNLPRDLKTLLRDKSSASISQNTKYIEVNVGFDGPDGKDCGKERTPRVLVQLLDVVQADNINATARWLFMRLEELLDPRSSLVSEAEGHPPLRLSVLQPFLAMSGPALIVNKLTTAMQFPGWKAVKPALMALQYCGYCDPVGLERLRCTVLRVLPMDIAMTPGTISALGAFRRLGAPPSAASLQRCKEGGDLFDCAVARRWGDYVPRLSACETQLAVTEAHCIGGIPGPESVLPEDWLPMEPMLKLLVRRLPAQRINICTSMFKEATKEGLDTMLLGLLREELAEAYQPFANSAPSLEGQAAIAKQPEGHPVALYTDRNSVPSHDIPPGATLLLLSQHGAGAFEADGEWLRIRCVESGLEGWVKRRNVQLTGAAPAAQPPRQATISCGEGESDELSRVHRLVEIVNGLVHGCHIGPTIATDPRWFMILLDVVRLHPAAKYDVQDVRNIAWSLLKRTAVLNTEMNQKIRRFEIDWEGDVFLTVYELRLVHALLTDDDDSVSLVVLCGMCDLCAKPMQ